MRPVFDVLSHLRHRADPGGVSDADLLQRFALGGDESAFELLVRRHGPLVLNTCRRILGGSADAEDAFQATFLALVRKAGSIRDGRALVGWLHHVARRTSLRALKSARARPERSGLLDVAFVATDDPACREIGIVLEEEVARLPQRMRLAFVLCQLEGQTAGEAAAQLGCPEGTILSRLSRARQRLRLRLTRRGLAPEPALPRATLPAALVTATLRSAGHFAARRVAGVVPGPILSLTQGVLREMFLSKLKGAAVLALILVASVGGVLAYTTRAGQRAAPPPGRSDRSRAQPNEEPRKPAAAIRLATRDKGLTHVSEVIVSPDGKFIVTTGTRPAGGLRPNPKEDIHEQVVLVWDSATGKLVHRITSAVGFGFGMAFSSDSKTLAVPNGGVGSITLYAVGTWKVRATLEVHPAVTQVVFTPDGKTLASWSETAFLDQKKISEVKLWDVATGRERLNLKQAKDESIDSMTLSPDGKTLAVGTSTGKVRLVNVATRKEGKALVAVANQKVVGTQAVFAPDSKTLATWVLTNDNLDKAARLLQLWDVATGKMLRTIDLEKGSIREAAFSPREPASHPLYGGQLGKGFIREAAFSPNGKSLVVASGPLSTATITVYDPATSKRQAALKLTDEWSDSDLLGLAFSPDGKILAASGFEMKEFEMKERGKPFQPVTMFYSLADRRQAAAPAGTRSVTFTPRGGKVVLIVGDGKDHTRETAPDEVTVRDATDLLPAR